MSQAKAYLASESAEPMPEEKVFLVYKFLGTSEAMIMQGILAMGDQTQARSYFKKIARMVHPDKNRHPCANEVFQKISHALELIQVHYPHPAAD